MDPVICPYCGNRAELVDSSTVYARSYGLIWRCAPCDAYVGTHKHGTKQDQPLGTLANAELRKVRQQAHKVFDALWNRQGAPMGRTEAYSWLASSMRLPARLAHIAMFNEERCREAIQLVKNREAGLTHQVGAGALRHFGA